MPYIAPIRNPIAALLPKTTNFVRFVFAQECDADWWVYAATFAPAFLKLAVMAAVPDLNDLIRGSGDTQIGQDKDARRRRGGKFRRGLAVQRQPAVQTFNARGLQFLFKITEPIEKIGFRWMLYSVTEQFFEDWQTLIIRSGACGHVPERGPLTRTSPSQGNPMLPGGNPVECPVVEANRSNWPTTQISASLPDGVFMITMAFNVIAPRGGIEGVFCQLRTNIVGVDQIQEGPHSGGGSDEPFSAMANFFIRVPAFFTAGVVWEIAGPAVPVGVTITDAFVSISRVDGTVGGV